MKTKLTFKTTIFALALLLALPLSANAAENWWGGNSFGWQRNLEDMGDDGPDPSLQGVTKEIYEGMKGNTNYPPMEREANGTVLMEPMSGEYYTPYSTTRTTIMSVEAEPATALTYKIDPKTEKLMREKRADAQWSMKA